MSNGDPRTHWIIKNLKEYSVKQLPSISQLSYHDRMKHLNLPSLQHRRRKSDLIYLYQILKSYYDIDNHLFTPSPSTTTARDHTMKLFKQHTNSYSRFNFIASE